MNVNFTPGPSQLFYTVQDHVREAFRNSIPSISHRSKEFEHIYAEVKSGLQELLGIPSGFHIFFTGSATEIWERSIQNLVEKDSTHFVNGAFSKRYFEIAGQLGKTTFKVESPLGSGFNEPVTLPEQTELIALTHNETSTGVSLPMAFINNFRLNYPEALIVVDAVSSLPYPNFDFTKIDSVYFSVQKGFGLPAGLGVWFVNDRCIAKAEKLANDGKSIGTYHSLPTLLTNEKKNQTPETPNVLNIYLLDKVIQDFNRRGIQIIRKETEYKAAILYQALETHGLVQPFVKDKASRSQTVIVAESGEHTESISKHLEKVGLFAGEGYGEKKKTQLRFANFPTHSKEQFELLVDTINTIV
ncbi:MAG: aminotransferase class V-fold PLP-dependent enzyme [Bacteroidia bacterium]|nr:aminotransferase class V-fold PLP-dependent enzyme [Bacteroidia bacterium]